MGNLPTKVIVWDHSGDLTDLTSFVWGCRSSSFHIYRNQLPAPDNLAFGFLLLGPPMSWFSWLPKLPALNISLTLPTSIQGRFLSFVLKRTLGHFFKPGHFDASQIDSQIGSGLVQVKDLELDDKVCEVSGCRI